MSRTGNLLKGVVLGMAVGAVAYLLSADSMKHTRKMIKRNTNKAVRSARDILEDIAAMVR